jgi:hypothetical protein
MTDEASGNAGKKGLGSTKYTLHIENITLAELPLRRLAAYIEEFARLLGEEASVRFEGVTDGSINLDARPLQIAAPKVRARLEAARQDALTDTRRAVNAIDTMLREDNGSGELREEGRPGVILRFAGANARVAELPVVVEPGALQGVLVRIGGLDETAHAQLLDGDKIHRCIVSHDLARALGRHLLGPVLRLHGRGRWRRGRDGTWDVVEFRASDFEVLDNASLTEAVTKLRATGGFGQRDAAGAWKALSEQRAD